MKDSWARYQALFENQPEWFFFVVTAIMFIGAFIGFVKLYQFSAYLVVALILVAAAIYGIALLGDQYAWGWAE